MNVLYLENTFIIRCRTIMHWFRHQRWNGQVHLSSFCWPNYQNRVLFNLCITGRHFWNIWNSLWWQACPVKRIFPIHIEPLILCTCMGASRSRLPIVSAVGLLNVTVCECSCLNYECMSMLGRYEYVVVLFVLSYQAGPSPLG